MRFRLVDAAKKNFPDKRLCKVLGVSPNGYFAWKERPASHRQRDDLVLLAHVRSAFALSNETYGSPRMTYELRDNGLAIGRRRIVRLMRELVGPGPEPAGQGRLPLGAPPHRGVDASLVSDGGRGPARSDHHLEARPKALGDHSIPRLGVKG